MPFLAVTLMILVLPSAAAVVRAAEGDPRPEVVVEATVSATPPGVVGEARYSLPCGGEGTEALLLFPNRFAEPEPWIDARLLAQVYPGRDFDPGGIEVSRLEIDGRRVDEPRLERVGLFEKTLLPLGPAPNCVRRTVTLAFRTDVPTRFGPFGAFGGQITLDGGWLPLPARLDPARPDGVVPARADFEVILTLDDGLEAVLSGVPVPRGAKGWRGRVAGVHGPALVAAPAFEIFREGDVTFYAQPGSGGWRFPAGTDPRKRVLDALVAATRFDDRSVLGRIAHQPSATATNAGERSGLVAVEAPLRHDLAIPAEGHLLVSDRALRVHALIAPFHEKGLAQGVFAETLAPTLAAVETRDFFWLREAVSRRLARKFVEKRHAEARTVDEWIRLFDIFAIVDRFEKAPYVPFVDAFFERSPDVDLLRGRSWTFGVERRPGWVVLDKLEWILGEEATAIEGCLDAEEPFRACLSQAIRRDVDPLVDPWLHASEVNYRFGEIELNEEGPAGLYRQRIDLVREVHAKAREAETDVREPVPLRLRSPFGPDFYLDWEGDTDAGVIDVTTTERVWQVHIDPDRELIETTREDNAWPFDPQVVLDTAEVEVSSTEFGLAGLVVARDRGDYDRDLALGGFFTNRSVGMTLGPRLHFGRELDPTLRALDLYAFWSFQELDDDFVDERLPDLKTPGQAAAFGLRFDAGNVVDFDNPIGARRLRLFADWHDDAIGSDYRFATYGAVLSGTQPLGSNRLLAAIEILNGFGEPFGTSRVPNQSRFSLGGSRSIRGIGAEDELGENLLLVRSELRWELAREDDLSLAEAIVARGGQFRFFVDAGRVSDRIADIYDVGDFAVGVGIGFVGLYDFLGFFPSRAYIEIATRVDDGPPDEVQFLFGTRQPF